MPLFLNTTGRASLGVGICDRCRKKMSICDLKADGDNPGLRVCDDCSDDKDPYSYAAVPAEDITLPFVRPDVDVST